MSADVRHLVSAGLALALCACGGSGEPAPATERVAFAPTVLAVNGQGEIKSAKPNPLTVPGTQWSSRQLTFVVADGTWVKEGELIARFAAEQSKVDLGQALIELRRTQLARAGTEAELGGAQGKLDVDLAEVGGLLGIARRYANATQGALARNTVLDAVQDQTFLTLKEGTLDWRKAQSSTRGQAELALNDAKSATNDRQVKDKRADLAALELHAPHAGLLVLDANWSGEKPHIGQTMWAGNPFASLPDPTSMEVQIALPQTEAAGIKEGLAVELAPRGRPDEKIVSKIAWVAAAAAQRDRDSPTKYVSMKAPVPEVATMRYHWAPGQQFLARVILLQSDAALTVPNIALENVGDSAKVSLRDGTGYVERAVTLGVRGPARTQILEGLKAGDEVVLVSARRAAVSGDKAALPAKKAARDASAKAGAP